MRAVRILCGFVIFLTLSCASAPPRSAIVFMTDYGLKDGAVSAMKGVAFTTAPSLAVSDLTHEIPPFDIWSGAYRLSQTYKYWPAGTVFVTVVDPGVGSQRNSIVLKTSSGHYFVGPDNGLYTLVAEEAGIAGVWKIDESRQRLKGSAESYTFHGRDLYAYVGARLASHQVKAEDVGENQKDLAVKLINQKPVLKEGRLFGQIPVLDPNYGNVWTNIPKSLVLKSFAGAKEFQVEIFNGPRRVYRGRLPLVNTFSSVPEMAPLLYFNSLLNLSIALNQGNFADRNRIGSGGAWTIQMWPVILPK